jgi:hypothetical protein
VICQSTGGIRHTLYQTCMCSKHIEPCSAARLCCCKHIAVADSLHAGAALAGWQLAAWETARVLRQQGLWCLPAEAGMCALSILPDCHGIVSYATATLACPTSLVHWPGSACVSMQARGCSAPPGHPSLFIFKGRLLIAWFSTPLVASYGAVSPLHCCAYAIKH